MFCPSFRPTTVLLAALDRARTLYLQSAFALVGGTFAIGNRVSLIRLLVLAVFFCGGIELLEVGTIRNFVGRGRFSSLADEPFAEDDGELGLGLEPSARADEARPSE